MSGNTAVIIGSQLFFRNTEGKNLFPVRLKHFRFPEGRQAAERFSQPPLRRIRINLHDFFSCRVSCIFHTDLQQNILSFFPETFRYYRKLRIGQSKTERIEYLIPGCCFKVTVTHVNIFRIYIFIWIAEARC